MNNIVTDIRMDSDTITCHVYVVSVVGDKKVQAGQRQNAATRARQTLLLDAL